MTPAYQFAHLCVPSRDVFFCAKNIIFAPRNLNGSRPQTCRSVAIEKENNKIVNLPAVHSIIGVKDLSRIS